MKEILREAVGISRSVNGPLWWITEDGTSLTELAEPLRARFDWSDLHTALAVIPAGRWTSYSDLAELISTAAQPLGQHLKRCPDCTNAFRVLESSGRSSLGFQWTDAADSRSQREALESEGVSFSGDQADPSKRLDGDALLALLATSSGQDLRDQPE